MELSILGDCDVAMLIFSRDGRVRIFVISTARDVAHSHSFSV